MGLGGLAQQAQLQRRSTRLSRPLFHVVAFWGVLLFRARS